MSRIAKWRAFSKQQIEEIVKNSRSDREVAEKLGYAKDGGGTKQSLHNMYAQLELDTSHFLGKGWNKNNFDYKSFEYGSIKKNGVTTLTPLIALRGRKCECCGLTEWLGKEINLEIHHKDGDRLNNSLTNLEILCPNCHSYTSNWRKLRKKKIISEEDFVYALQHNSSIRQTLLALGLSAAGGNYDRAKELIVKYNITNIKLIT